MKSKGYSIRRKFTAEEWWAYWEAMKEGPRVQFRRQAINDFRRQLDVASPRPATDGSSYGSRGIPSPSGPCPSHGPTPSLPWAEPAAADLHHAREAARPSELTQAWVTRITAGAASDACNEGPGPTND